MQDDCKYYVKLVASYQNDMFLFMNTDDVRDGSDKQPAKQGLLTHCNCTLQVLVAYSMTDNLLQAPSDIPGGKRLVLRVQKMCLSTQRMHQLKNMASGS